MDAGRETGLAVRHAERQRAALAVPGERRSRVVHLCPRRLRRATRIL